MQLFSVASAASPRPAHRLQLYIRPLGAATVVMGLLVLFIGPSFLVYHPMSLCLLSFILHDLLRRGTVLHRPSGIDEWELPSLANDD